MEYTTAPLSFISLAFPTAFEATSGEKLLWVVGVPSVKKMTTFLASERPAWPFASSKPAAAFVAPAGSMAFTWDEKAPFVSLVHGASVFITWL